MIAPADIRHSAQTVFGIIILGIGPILSAVYNDQFDQPIKATGSYASFWLAQAGIAAICAVLLAVLFPRDRGVSRSGDVPPPATH